MSDSSQVALVLEHEEGKRRPPLRLKPDSGPVILDFTAAIRHGEINALLCSIVVHGHGVAMLHAAEAARGNS